MLPPFVSGTVVETVIETKRQFQRVHTGQNADDVVALEVLHVDHELLDYPEVRRSLCSTRSDAVRLAADLRTIPALTTTARWR